MAYEIQLRAVSAQSVLSIRAVVPTLDLVRFFEEAVSDMQRYLAQTGVRAAGPAMSLWHSAPGEIPDVSDIETCLPIERPIPSAGRIKCRTLPAGLQASTVHHGAYDDMGNAFDAVWQWIQAHGYEMVGPPADVVLVGPDDSDDPAAFRTEIVYPVRQQ